MSQLSSIKSSSSGKQKLDTPRPIMGFVSCTTSQFKSARALLKHELQAAGIEVLIQEDVAESQVLSERW
jgi:hypothetical protein